MGCIICSNLEEREREGETTPLAGLHCRTLRVYLFNSYVRVTFVPSVRVWKFLSWNSIIAILLSYGIPYHSE